MSDHLPYCTQCGQMFRGHGMEDAYMRAHPESEHGKDLNRAFSDGLELIAIEPNGIRVYRRLVVKRTDFCIFILLMIDTLMLAALVAATLSRLPA